MTLRKILVMEIEPMVSAFLHHIWLAQNLCSTDFHFFWGVIIFMAWKIHYTKPQSISSYCYSFHIDPIKGTLLEKCLVQSRKNCIDIHKRAAWDVRIWYVLIILQYLWIGIIICNIDLKPTGGFIRKQFHLPQRMTFTPKYSGSSINIRNTSDFLAGI